MRRALSFIIPIFLISSGVAFYWFNRPKPTIETKFVQNVGSGSGKLEVGDGNNEVGNGISQVIVKEPGNYALLDNPKHTYQTFNNCGPATLSMILSWYGKKVSQKELGDAMRPYQIASGDNDDKTIFTDEFVEWAQKYGLIAISRPNGDITTLKKFTANGIPVVVKTWLHVNEDIGHFRIVRGFDEGKSVIIQDDSYEGPNKRISYYDFLSMWQPFNYDYMIVYTPDKEDLVKVIMGDEMDEKVAWQNALERGKKENELDSENIYPLFNMTVAYERLGDHSNSATSFEKIENKLPKRMLWYQIEPIKAYQALENYDRVFQIIDKILNNGNRAFSELYQIRGEIYLDQGNKDLANREFELALQYNKNFTPAKESLNH